MISSRLGEGEVVEMGWGSIECVLQLNILYKKTRNEMKLTRSSERERTENIQKFVRNINFFIIIK
jgi:hypothetical protein